MIYTLKEDVDEDIHEEKVVHIEMGDHEWVFYPTEANDIRLYIYHDEKLVHSGTIEYEDLKGEKIMWTYAKDDSESDEFSYIVGAIEKDYEPLVSVNGKDFDGSVIALDHAYVFFSDYDNTLSSAPEIILKGERR